MKKSLVKFFAGVTAAASLLLASCTTQNDYLDETTALNKMNIKGFTVTGLDQAYDQATAKLMVKEGVDEDGAENMVCIGEAVVAAYDATKGYKSGTAYAKFDEPYLYDGDKLQTSKLECYLVVGKDEFKVADTVNGAYKNAVLSVKTSPAGTADKDLAASFIAISVYDGVASYAFASNATEQLAVPVYMCDFDISSAASAEDLPEGVTIETTAKTGTNSKYTVIFKGLVDNVGTKFVVAGSAISSKDENLGDNWNIMETPGLKVSAVVTDKGLISTVDETGTLTFEFYGSKPSWASNASPAIKIAAYNVDTDPWTCLLCANGDNWFFPNYTDGNDVTMTVDITKLDESSWTKSKAAYEAVSFYVDGIKVLNAPSPNNGKVFFVDGDDDPNRIEFVPGNTWSDTSNFYTASEKNSKGNVSWVFDEPVKVAPNAKSFKLGARLVNPKAGGGFWDNQIGSYTNNYVTTEFANKHVTLIIDAKANYEYLVLSSTVDYEFEVTLNKLIVNKALDGVELIGGFNGWGDAGTIPGTVVGSTTEFDISAISASQLGQIKIRTAGAWSPINIGASTGSGNIELPTYSKSGKVNIVCEYASGSNVDSIKLEYVE